MAQRESDRYFDQLERKPRAKEAHRQSKETYTLHKKRQAALSNLTNGGFLVPKPEVLKEGLQELREVGHAKADKVAQIRRRLKT